MVQLFHVFDTLAKGTQFKDNLQTWKRALCRRLPGNLTHHLTRKER